MSSKMAFLTIAYCTQFRLLSNTECFKSVLEELGFIVSFSCFRLILHTFDSLLYIFIYFYFIAISRTIATHESVKDKHLSQGQCATSMVCNNLCYFFNGYTTVLWSKDLFRRFQLSENQSLKCYTDNQISSNQRCTKIDLNVFLHQSKGYQQILYVVHTWISRSCICCIFTSYIVNQLIVKRHLIMFNNCCFAMLCYDLVWNDCLKKSQTMHLPCSFWNNFIKKICGNQASIKWQLNYREVSHRVDLALSFLEIKSVHSV